MRTSINALQLPLNLKLHDEAIFDNFLSCANAPLVEILKNFAIGKSESLIYCYGESGFGRTHLLQACCHAAQKNNHSVFYLPLAHHAEFSAAILEGLEEQECVCIDDIDHVLGDDAWEEALFHFYNRAREKETRLLVSAACSPKQLGCRLPDLQSRLSSALVLAIKKLTDAQKMQALQLRAESRGFYLSEEVMNYLIHHFSRNMRDLFQLLEKLDQASLIEKRRITLPFVKWVMQFG